MLAARPHAADAITNTTTPARNMRRRPNRSPIEPHSRISALRNSAYDSITHCTSITVPPRLLWRAGRATFTTVLSMKAMLDPRIVTTRIHGSAAFAQSARGLPDSITAWSQGGFIDSFAKKGPLLTFNADYRALIPHPAP